ncbi:MAG: ABC transporter ATP-binding protein [Chloroflexi bacterium CG_4_10_14_0_8_um_filter_46_9]|nr:MAG: ABC transporter ATP-binding protein [Chloroflexi bacterium CG_4_10_14_0_8_um_filter_46_9]
MSLIKVVDLSHNYSERKVLENITLSIAKGEVFALIGPTGVGKTTLLRLIDLLEIPSSGEIYFDGRCIPESGKQRVEIRRRMAFVLQKPQVFNLSVYDNIACGLRWRGEKKDRTKEKVDRILETVDLRGYKNRNARTLSGGEAQRLALARAAVVEPEVLLLDEPTANLDPISTEKIEQFISYLIRQRNTTIIMATHDMPQGQHLANRIGVLLDGKIVQTGDVEQVFRSPQDEEVANFVGMENIIEGVVTANNEGMVTLDIGGGAIQAVSDFPVGERVYVCVRPEDITLALSRTQSSARNSFYGKITQVVSFGPLTRVEMDCGFRLVSLVTKVSVEELSLQKRKEVYASFKATGVHLIKRRAK